MPRVVIHDFRVTDRFLADTDPDAGDVVYVGPGGSVAFPFVVWRKLSGPGGWYVDGIEIRDASGTRVASWERKFELEGESVVGDVVDEMRHVAFPAPGDHLVRYSVYDEHHVDVPFAVLAEDPPYAGVVPGPVDAALSKSTIAWVEVPAAAGGAGARPVWYGYADGRILVLMGPGEQMVPGLAATTHATVIARSKDKQSRVGEAQCRARVLPKDDEWARIARDVLVGRRLNLTDGERAVDRWRETCEIVALTPLPAPRT